MGNIRKLAKSLFSHLFLWRPPISNRVTIIGAFIESFPCLQNVIHHPWRSLWPPWPTASPSSLLPPPPTSPKSKIWLIKSPPSPLPRPTSLPPLPSLKQIPTMGPLLLLLRPPPNGISLKSPKIQLPFFDGSAPLDWLFQADQYFNFYQIKPEQRLSIVAFHLKGDALSWYKYLHNNRLLTDWASFTRALELRFGPSSFENHQASLFKLSQTSSVSAYQTEFERISNCVVGLSQDALLNCFISGLRIDIQQELSLHNPSSIHQAYGLSKLIEDKVAANSPRHSSSPHTVPFSPSPSPPPQSPSTTLAILPTPPQPPTALPLRRLTPAEVQARRSQGLCFRCPEKYHPGHRCTPPQFLLLESTEEIPTSIPFALDPGVSANGLEDKALF